MLMINHVERISIEEILSFPLFSKMKIEKGKFEENGEISPYMCVDKEKREILIKWLYEVSQEADTLFSLPLTVNILDTYLSKTKEVKLKHLQKIGVSCKYIADLLLYGNRESRFYSIITDNTYTNREVRNTVWEICETLEWTLYKKTFIDLPRFRNFDYVIFILLNHSFDTTPEEQLAIYKSLTPMKKLFKTN